MTNYKELFKNVNTFVFDYDGVMTDGTILLMQDGDALRTANVKDGYVIKRALKQGYRVVVITGGRSVSMEERFRELGITEFFLNAQDKLQVFRQYLNDNGLDASQVLYMGDDIPDLLPMMETGVATCPYDAAEEIKAISHYISDYHGGRGCVRDVVEQVMKVQGNWLADIDDASKTRST
ncbi:MAG: 3-deoxy-D-manno-octulosonate 8-phosphate phosphatase [Bacteroidales bacterium]|nr:3-deoxy-D-manno-octulosonate 8-phosphate phosphatase [Bacteroidales bacterium]